MNQFVKSVVLDTNSTQYKLCINLGMINYLIAGWFFRNIKEREVVLLFYSISGRFVRFLTYDLVRMNTLKRLNIRDIIISIFSGGVEIPQNVTLQNYKDNCLRYGTDRIPCVRSGKRIVDGIMRRAYELDALEFHAGLCIEFSNRWSCYRSSCVDVSLVSSANLKIIELSRIWKNVKIFNNNPLWFYYAEGFGSLFDSRDENYDNKGFEDEWKYITDLVHWNELSETFEILQKLQNVGVGAFFFSIPDYDELPHTEDEVLRHENNITGFDSLKDRLTEQQQKKVYDFLYPLKCINEIGFYCKQIHRHGITKLADAQMEYYHVYDGKRLTVGGGGHERRIHVFGPCTIGGAYVSDEWTIPSIIQSFLNENKIEYDVINYGTMGYYRTYVSKIIRCNISAGDVVVVVDRYPYLWNKKTTVQVFSLKEAYLEGPKDMYFEIPAHMSAKGNESVARFIYNSIEGALRQENKRYYERRVRVKLPYNESNHYLEEIEQLEKKYNRFVFDKNKTYGAIVMNCNPFTLGHKHLVEYAYDMVDFLFVFVVEEDKSFFKFEDRFYMVKKGCESFENVCVIPSGRWILSNATLPEYFSKEDEQNQVVCGSDDLEIFANDVVPIFHISKRFVGAEPFDLVTRQYNESMKRILTDYGVDVIEIPRKEIDGIVISATEIRNFMKQNKFDEIKKYVPESTFEVIKKYRVKK